MKGNKKQHVEQEVSCDTGRLYGSIDDAIRYLEEIRDAHRGTNISLDEHWTGYEDMEMRFVFTREETDEEMSERLRMEALKRQVAERERQFAADRARDMKEYERLAQKLGRRY